MPDARTHDRITVITGAVLAPLAYTISLSQTDSPERAITETALLVGAHLLSGMMFSPDLDIDSSIDNRWGIFFWIWRPYMWIVPHRHFWSHSLIFSALLRLAYFYAVIVGLLVGITWLLGQVGIVFPYYHAVIADSLLSLAREHPRAVAAFVIGFETGSAAHTIADWLVTGGKRYLRRFGITIRRDYSRHDRYVPRMRR